MIKITIKQNSSSSFSQSICQGSSYLFNGSALTTAGTYKDTLTTANGCDSIVTLILSIKPKATKTITTTICQGLTYTVGAQVFSSAGTYTITLIGAAANGCDSIVTLNLTVSPKPTPVILLTGTDTLSTGAFAHYIWLRNNNPIPADTIRAILVSQNGSYRVFVIDSNGCSDTSALFLVAHLGIDDVQEQGSVSLYPNPNSGSFILSTEQCRGKSFLVHDMLGRVLLQQQITADRQQVEIDSLSAGLYLLTIHGSKKEVRFLVDP